MPQYDDLLRQLYQQTARKKSLEAMVRDLRERCGRLRDQVEQLRYVMEREQYDVDKLECGGLAAFFYGVLGKMDEKMTKEKEEAYAARVRYDAAALELQTLEEDLSRKEAELASLAGCEEQYRRVLQQKAEALKAAGGELGRQLLSLEERLAFLQHQDKELREARQAGEDCLQAADAVLGSLDSAQGWATFDMFSDSVFADIAKYSRLDDAERRVHDLQLRLDRFKTELADVTIETDMQVGVRGFDRFADYFFDNIFTDWAVMDRISNSQSQVSRTRSQIAGVLQGLETMTAQTAQERVRVQETLDRLVRESGFAPGGLNG